VDAVTAEPPLRRNGTIADNQWLAKLAAAITAKVEFLNWYNTERKDMDWVTPLYGPDFLPPKRIDTRFVNGGRWYNGGGWLSGIGLGGNYMEYVLPCGWEWDNDGSLGRYHPAAAKGIRKADASGSGAQAVYDSTGALITGGISAGSADRYTSFREHMNGDVAPFDWARTIDTFWGAKKYRTMYYDVRPAIVPSGADPNPRD